MVDQVGQEEEYHFKDLGQTSDSDTTEETVNQDNTVETDNMFQTKKRVFIAAGGAFLLVVVYNLVTGLFSSKKAESPKIMQKPKQMSANTTSPKINPPQISERIKPQIPAPIVRPRPPVKNKNESISSQAQTAFEGLNRTLRSIEVAIKDLDSRVIDLQAHQSKIQKQFDERKKAEQEKIKAVNKKKKKGIPIKMQYEVIGIIHGRAWLKTPRGDTLTVRPGDKLSGYGRVKLIEHEQGVVVMTSGEVIKFNDN